MSRFRERKRQSLHDNWLFFSRRYKGSKSLDGAKTFLTAHRTPLEDPFSNPCRGNPTASEIRGRPQKADRNTARLSRASSNITLGQIVSHGEARQMVAFCF